MERDDEFLGGLKNILIMSKLMHLDKFSKIIGCFKINRWRWRLNFIDGDRSLFYQLNNPKNIFKFIFNKF